MENYFIQSEPTKAVTQQSMIDPNLESATLEDVPQPKSVNPCLPICKPVDSRLACILEKYLLAPKKPQSTTKIKKLVQNGKNLTQHLLQLSYATDKKRKTITQQKILQSPHGKLEFLGVNLNIFFKKR
jgi:hypothetical protein